MLLLPVLIAFKRLIWFVAFAPIPTIDPDENDGIVTIPDDMVGTAPPPGSGDAPLDFTFSF
jgi:hypothetical protein